MYIYKYIWFMNVHFQIGLIWTRGEWLNRFLVVSLLPNFSSPLVATHMPIPALMGYPDRCEFLKSFVPTQFKIMFYRAPGKFGQQYLETRLGTYQARRNPRRVDYNNRISSVIKSLRKKLTDFKWCTKELNVLWSQCLIFIKD